MKENSNTIFVNMNFEFQGIERKLANINNFQIFARAYVEAIRYIRLTGHRISRR